MNLDLKQLFKDNKVIEHKTSKEEIANLFGLVDRDIKDSKIKELSSDRRFATVYNAALQLATILLYGKGYKTKGAGHHYVTFMAMKTILGKEYHGLADYLDACRSQRNKADYTLAGSVSESEVEELIEETKKFRSAVKNWVTKHL